MELLQQHFDTAFASPNGIPKLRELILKLAMQGKLVPQDPSDQPAKELLKEIEAERKRLAKEHKVKAPKPQPDIGAEELPGVLPDGWAWVRNGFLFDLKKGKVPKDLSESEGSIPYLDIEALDRGNVRRYTNDTKAPQSTDRDILVVCDGSRSGLVLEGKNGAIGSTLSVIETPLFIQPFVKLIFRQGYQRMNSSMKGAAIPHLDSKTLLLEVIGLPPLAEQKRILDKVEELIARCDELQKLRAEQEEKRWMVHTSAIRQLLSRQGSEAWDFIKQHFNELYSVKENVAELRKAILQLAVMGRLVPQDPNDQPANELLKKIETEKHELVKSGKIKAPKPLRPIEPEELPYELPQGWEWVRLGSISLSSDSGWSPQCLPERSAHNQWGVLKVSSVSWGKFDPEENKALPIGKIARPEFEVKAGDFLLSRANTDELVARSVVVEKTREKLMMSDKIVRFELSKYINKHFVNVANCSDFSRAYYIANASGTSSSMKNVGRQVMTELPIPLPPLSEQHRIVMRINQLIALCDMLDQKISAATNKKIELLNAVMVRVASTEI